MAFECNSKNITQVSKCEFDLILQIVYTHSGHICAIND